jgi:peptidoglycan LD-endopeptidase CwlK
MAKLGAASQAVYDTLDPRLQVLVDRILVRLSQLGLDLKLVQGHRSSADQLIAYQTGHSEKKPGTSKHERTPSLAVDMALYPVHWPDEAAFGFLAGMVAIEALDQGIKVRWGGDWDGDGDTLEHSLRDLDHWELVE